MAKKAVQIGKITVIIDDKFDAYEKPVPKDADPGYEWLGNFGISKDGKKLNGKVLKYQIEVEDRDEKTLYFWYEGKAHTVPNQKKVDKGKKKFRVGELDLGDPAVGWD